MAAFEVIALDTATPQLRAPGAADTYTFPRAVEMPLGTANGVLYLNGSKVVTSGSALTFDGSATFAISAATPIFQSVASATNALHGLELKTGSSIDAFFKQLPNSGELRIGSGRSVGWGGFTSFYIDTLEQMRLTSTGLGIGTSPSARLSISDGTTPKLNFVVSGVERAFLSYVEAGFITRLDSDGPIELAANNTINLSLDAFSNVAAGLASRATTATDGFLYVPTCAGTPTGVPRTKTGFSPIVVDTTNNKLYFYSGGAWRDAGP
jgi:hypothetical protein